MQICDLSVFGTVVLIVASVMCAAFFVLLDRKMVTKLERNSLLSFIQIGMLGAVTWGVYHFNMWWADLIWFTALTLFSSLLLLGRIHCVGSRLLIPVFASQIIGISTAASCLIWILSVSHSFFSSHFFVPVVALIASQVHSSLREGIQTYLSSLRRTLSHRQFLLSNGATHLESLIPSVRRALRASLLPFLRIITSPAVLIVPLFYGGMLLGGATPLLAACVLLLLYIASFVAIVVSQVTFLWLSDRLIFDKNDNLVV